MAGLNAESYLSYLFFKRPYDMIIAVENILFPFVRRWFAYCQVRCFIGHVPTPDKSNKIDGSFDKEILEQTQVNRRGGLKYEGKTAVLVSIFQRAVKGA